MYTYFGGLFHVIYCNFNYFGVLSPEYTTDYSHSLTDISLYQWHSNLTLLRHLYVNNVNGFQLYFFCCCVSIEFYMLIFYYLSSISRHTHRHWIYITCIHISIFFLWFHNLAHLTYWTNGSNYYGSVNKWAGVLI